MNEKGAANGNSTQFAQKRDGMFGGLQRVYDGIMQTDTDFRAVPGEARREAINQREKIYGNSKSKGLNNADADQRNAMVKKSS